MSQTPDRTFNSDFRRFFLRGLVILLPTVLTLWIVVKAYQFVDNSIAEPINQSIRLGITKAIPTMDPLKEWFEPNQEVIEAEILAGTSPGGNPPTEAQVRARLRGENVRSWWDNHWYMDLIGFVVAVVGVYIAGVLLGGFFGRQIYRKIETVITTLPIFKQVYPYVKQIVDFLFSDDKPIEFSRVVVVEYPRKGIWSVGFQTGSSMKSVAEEAGDSVTIFIPSSPTPFTGYTITVPRSEVRELPITVEEAIRFAVSGGVLVPDHQLVAIKSVEDEKRLPIAIKDETTAESDEDDTMMDNEDTQSENRRRNAS